MLDQFKKSVYAAVGLAVMTADKIEEVGRKIAKDTEMSEKEGREFIEELRKKGEDTRLAIEKIVNEKVEKALGALSIPSHSELDRLKKRVEKIEQELSEMDSQ